MFTQHLLKKIPKYPQQSPSSFNYPINIVSLVTSCFWVNLQH